VNRGGKAQPPLFFLKLKQMFIIEGVCKMATNPDWLDFYRYIISDSKLTGKSSSYKDCLNDPKFMNELYGKSFTSIIMDDLEDKQLLQKPINKKLLLLEE
jgi:hypothetical protein